LGTKWAASGFVSLHINHAGCDDSVWKNNIRPMKELREIYPYFVSGRIHANDVRFVIDQLELLAKNDPVWEQMLDMSRIGAAGYDLGGLGTLLLAGQLPLDRGEYLYDSRVKAIIVMSPPVNSSPYAASAIYETVQTPVLFFTGTEDNGIIGTTKAPQRRIPFDHLINADRFLVTYNGADHLVYGGHILPINNRNEKLLQNNIAEVSLIFWKAYLAGDPKMYQYLRKNAIGNLIGHAGTIERKLVPVLVPMTSAEMDKNSSAAIE
jgi:predicted dienelactone hydrolase